MRLLDRATAGDRALLLAVLLASLASLAALPRALGPAAEARVLVDGEVAGVLALDRARTVEYTGRLGPVVVVTEYRRVRIADAPCPNRLCVGQGWASRRGEVRVCVPSGVVVEVTGGDRPATDAVTR